MNFEKRSILKRIQIAQRIQLLMKKKGYGNNELASQCGFAKGYMSEIIHAKRNLTLSTIVKLEEVLGDKILIPPKE